MTDAAAYPALDLQGHRGARGLAPENTLAGFARAMAVGVTTLEMDLGLTRDGVIVVTHDPILNPELTRGPDGRWLAAPGPAVVTLSHAELALYDVGRLRPGSAAATAFPDQVPRDGERIPRLLDVFALVRGLESAVRFNLEVKTSPVRPDETAPSDVVADAVVQVVRDAGWAPRATVQSFDWRVVRRVHETAAEIRTACLTSEQPEDDTVDATGSGPRPWLDGLDPASFGGSLPRLVQAMGSPVWSPDFRDLDPRRCAEAHDLGLAVVVWTVNEPGEMARLIDLGVDGIITDRPDRLREVMAARGMPVPRPAPAAP